MITIIRWKLLWKFCYFLLSMFISQEIRFSLVFSAFKNGVESFNDWRNDSARKILCILYFLWHCTLRETCNVLYCIFCFLCIFKINISVSIKWTFRIKVGKSLIDYISWNYYIIFSYRMYVSEVHFLPTTILWKR